METITNILWQYEIELKYASKWRQCVILDNLDTCSLHGVIDNIKEYKSKEYSYQSKIERIEKIKPIPEDEILITIITSVVNNAYHRLVPIQGIATELARFLIKISKDTLVNSIKTAAELLVITQGVTHKIYTAKDKHNTTGNIAIEGIIELPEEVIQEIKMTQYLPPMVTKPTNWKNNYRGGYLTVEERVTLNSIGSVNQNLEAINKLQSVPLVINQDMVQFTEEPSKELDTPDKLFQFAQMAEESKAVYDLLKANPIWFVWKYDTRGRMYSQGYHVNIQGSKYKRSLINLFHKERVTE